MKADAGEELRDSIQRALGRTHSIEEATYLWEDLYLHQEAAKSRDMEETREKPEDRSSDPYRTPFQHDRDRIIHSKAFRRLAHKTQIYIAPEGDHFRTRLSHSLEVAQLARTGARALRLNEDLVEAIALGHDLGHAPFGHGGEEALQHALSGTFDHHEQGYLVVTKLTVIDRLPLNLSQAARWGIRRSSRDRRPRKGEPAETQEERLVKYVDDIAWVNHDIDDAIMTGILSQSDLGVCLLQTVGRDRRRRLSYMMASLIEESRKYLSEGGSVAISSELEQQLEDSAAVLEEKVWRHPSVAERTEAGKQYILALFEHFKAHPDDLPGQTRDRLESGDSMDDVLRDHISGMTDRYAIRQYREFHGPETPLARPEVMKPPDYPCEGYRRVGKGPGRKQGDRVTLEFGSRHGAEVGAVYRVCFYGRYGTLPSRCDIEDVVGRVKVEEVLSGSCRAVVLDVKDADRPIETGCVLIRDTTP